MSDKKSEKVKRPERLTVISKTLAEHPGQLMPFSYFTQILGCAKSSLSEDLALLRTIYDKHHLGRIETIVGANGGIIYQPYFNAQKAEELANHLCNLIAQPERILPGGYIYLTDLIGNPELMHQVGLFFAERYRETEPEAVLTIETKGIPIGLMTARALNLPLVIVRSDSRISEGTSIGISYLSETQKRLVTMSLPKRSFTKNTRILFIDDFLRGGGTAKGILDLVNEFESNCVGMGFLVDIAGGYKAVHDYTALLTLEYIDVEHRKVAIHKGNWQ